MKRFVKIISLVLTLAMVFSVMSVGAWALDVPTASVTIKVVDEGGNQLGGAAVYGYGKFEEGTTDSNGEFSLSELKADDYFFNVNLAGYYVNGGGFRVDEQGNVRPGETTNYNDGVITVTLEKLPTVSFTLVKEATVAAGSAMPDDTTTFEFQIKMDYELEGDFGGIKTATIDVDADDYVNGVATVSEEITLDFATEHEYTNWLSEHANITIKEVNLAANWTCETEPITVKGNELNGRSFTFENTYNKPVVAVRIEVPFTKVVELGGNTEPGETEFQLEMLTPYFKAETIEIVNNTITTNGAGEYEGAFIFSISEDELGMLSEGFVLKEVAEEDSNWNCDTTPWLVYVVEPPMEFFSAEDVDSNLVVTTYEAEYVEGEETVEGQYSMVDQIAKEIVFVNTYTKNTVNPPVQEYDPEPTPKDKVVVKKVWVGDDEKTRPEEITVQLYKNGKKYEKPVKLSADKDIYENWRHVWEDVNEDEDTVWSVKELNVPDGYSVSIEQRRSNYFIITNTLNEKPNPETGASDFVGAAVALAVCSTVCGAALMLKRK